MNGFSEKKLNRTVPASHTASKHRRGNNGNRTLTKGFAQSVFTKPNGIPPVSSARLGSPGEIRTPVDGFLPGFRGPKPIIGRVICFRPLLVHYTTGLQETRVSGQVPISLLRQSNQHFQI